MKEYYKIDLTINYALGIFITLISFWACGGMVDTLVLGTSANAWEFESLHAQVKRQDKKFILSFIMFIEFKPVREFTGKFIFYGFYY